MNKIKLEKSMHHPAFEKSTKSILLSLPFYKSRSGKYFHRVRCADNHWKKGRLSHTSVHFLCGNGGFIGDKGMLYGEVPEDGVLCATCEGRAIGAGLDGIRMINGKSVMYAARDTQHK